MGRNKRMNDYPKILKLNICAGECLGIQFDTRSENNWYSVRLKDLITKNKYLRHLREDNNFYKAEIEEFGGAIEWNLSSGEVGIGGDQLYSLALIQSGEAESLEAFALQNWKVEEGFTNAQIAQELGVSERTIVNYLKDPKSMPKHILLAIDGWRFNKQKHAGMVS
jgi:hypothetical protein